jgi:hypothetical protein
VSRSDRATHRDRSHHAQAAKNLDASNLFHLAIFPAEELGISLKGRTPEKKRREKEEMPRDDCRSMWTDSASIPPALSVKISAANWQSGVKK